MDLRDIFFSQVGLVVWTALTPIWAVTAWIVFAQMVKRRKLARQEGQAFPAWKIVVPLLSAILLTLAALFFLFIFLFLLWFSIRYPGGGGSIRNVIAE